MSNSERLSASGLTFGDIAEAVTAIERGQVDGSIRGDVQALPQALQLWTSMLGIVLVDLNQESMASRLPMPVDMSQLVPLHLDTLIRALAAEGVR